MPEFRAGFVYLHEESAKVRPSDPCFEVVFGVRAEGWSPTSVDEMPVSIVKKGGHAGQFKADLLVIGGIALFPALTLAYAYNAIQLTTGGGLWALVFVDGESPVSIHGLGGRFL